MATNYRAPAIKRTVQIIEHLAGCPAPRRLSDLSSHFGLSKSSLHGILHTLVEEEWLVKDETGGFSLSRHLLEVVQPAFSDLDVRWLAKPFMEELSADLGETVFLGRPEGKRVVVEECIQGTKEMCIGSQAGVRIPLLAGALGKLFLADTKEDGEILEVLRESGIPRFTENTITDPQAYLEEIGRVRERGYALDDEEYLRGVRAVAVPVRKYGETVAALWVVGFTSQMLDDVIDRFRRELTKASAIISRLLSSGASEGPVPAGRPYEAAAQ
jgi:DNA-binding IclR family transcriptional regulator